MLTPNRAVSLLSPDVLGSAVQIGHCPLLRSGPFSQTRLALLYSTVQYYKLLAALTSTDIEAPRSSQKGGKLVILYLVPMGYSEPPGLGCLKAQLGGMQVLAPHLDDTPFPTKVAAVHISRL